MKRAGFRVLAGIALSLWFIFFTLLYFGHERGSRFGFDLFSFFCEVAPSNAYDPFILLGLFVGLRVLLPPSVRLRRCTAIVVLLHLFLCSLVEVGCLLQEGEFAQRVASSPMEDYEEPRRYVLGYKLIYSKEFGIEVVDS